MDQKNAQVIHCARIAVANYFRNLLKTHLSGELLKFRLAM